MMSSIFCDKEFILMAFGKDEIFYFIRYIGEKNCSQIYISQFNYNDL